MATITCHCCFFALLNPLLDPTCICYCYAQLLQVIQEVPQEEADLADAQFIEDAVIDGKIAEAVVEELRAAAEGNGGVMLEEELDVVQGKCCWGRSQHA